MSKNSVAKNYIYNMVYQILAIIIPLITTPYLSRVLGPEKIGIYSYTLSITTYFILFGSLGVAMYGQREIAYVQKDIKKRSIIFFEIFFMKCLTLLISLLLFYLTFCINDNYSIYYKILILEIIANAIDISWYFQGLEEFKKTVLRNMLVKIISVICIFIFVRNQDDFNKYFFIYVLSNFFGNFSLWFYLSKYTKKVTIKELNIFKHLKPTIALFIPQVATQIYTVLDKTMIGAIVEDKVEVGYYEQAQKIIKLLITIATSLGIVMLPRIAATYAEKNYKKVKEYLKKSFAFIMLLAFPLMFGIISVASKFVPVFYGAGYDKVVYLISIISPIVVLIGLSNVMGIQYLLPTKQHKKYTLSVIIGAIVNLILNLLLIYNFKSIGASIATIFAELAVTAIQFVLLKKEISFIEILKISYKYIIASIIMFLVSLFIGYIILNNVLSIICQIIFSSIIYFITLVLLKDRIIFEFIDLIKEKIKNKKNY